MKKIFASVGLAAIGASTLHAQYAPNLTPQETTKPWALSGSVRGFYDDNYLTLPSHPSKISGLAPARSSWGTEVSPSVEYNHSAEQTYFGLSYVYDLRYYQDRSTTDQTHQFNAVLDHAFSERYKLDVDESFVIAQEPTVIDPTVVTSPLRTSGNNVRNTGSMGFTAELTQQFDLHINYINNLYAYQQNRGDIYSTNHNPGVSRSALLDRIEQPAAIDLRWKALPETTGVLGYQFEDVSYTSPEPIVIQPPHSKIPNFVSNYRDNDSHTLYAGVDQSLTGDLTFSLRAGGQYVDYRNAHTSRLSPYADASLTWHYLPTSYVQAGLKQLHNATDAQIPTGGSPVLDEDSTAVYASISHQFLPNFTVSGLGQFQHSTFVGGGTFNGQADDFYILGLNLAYRFNPFIMAEAGYNYSKLNSDIIDRGYSRNQVYIGVRATY